MKFRKKPIIIEAEQFLGFDDTGKTVNRNLFKFTIDDKTSINSRTLDIYDDHIDIHTLEGIMRADINDWIIRGVNGELYPCKPDIFEKTYEKVDDNDGN